MGHSKSSSKMEVYSNTAFLKNKKISNKQPNLPPKRIRKKKEQSHKSAEGRK